MSEKLKSFFKSTDRKLLGVALVLISFSLYYLLVDDTLFGLLRSRDEDSNRPLVGQISTFENDTRHKSVKSFAWSKARKDQQVRLGDSVFTGSESKSRVTLTDGGYVDMSENTLIHFDDVRGLKVPNLRMGQFKLSVSGTMRVAIDNKITEIKGDGSEVQVTVAENKKPVLKVTRGKAEVKESAPIEELKVSKAPPPPPVEVAKPQAPPPPVAPPPAPVEPKLELKAEASAVTYKHTDQLYDFYERLPQSLKKRPERRHEVNLPVPLRWGSNLPTQKVYGQISQTAGFEQAVQYFETSEQGGYTYRPVYIGTNYWRVSSDRKNWSNIEWFQVETQPLNIQAPDISLDREKVYIFDDKVKVQARISAPAELKAFVIEMSSDPQFAADNVKVVWSSQRQMAWTFSNAGDVYFRARGVNEKTEITAGGAIAKLTLVRPPKVEAPKLAKQQIQTFEYDKVQLNWDQSPRAKGYQVEFVDPKGKVISRETVKDSQWTWKGGAKGTYQARVFALDQFGRKSDTSAQSEVLVAAKPVAKVAPLPKKKEETRTPASVDSTVSMKADDVSGTYLNRQYPSSKMELIGSGFTMYSSEQVGQGREQPLALLMGLHIQHWFNDHGADAYFKSKVVNVNSTAGQASPLQAELRYQYRWKLHWNTFSNLRESQLSAILGYELYRNQNSGTMFTPNYDLVKLGAAMVFPLFDRWDTGGEVLYGHGFDSSKKYELAGYVNYYLRRDWSAGVGYRLHLFEAGSTRTAPPTGLPFREGFGEAYSVLRWHY